MRIEERIGRAHLQPAEQLVPEAARLRQRLGARRAAASGAPAASRLRASSAWPEHEGEGGALAGGERELAGHRGAGVEAAAGALAQRVGHLDAAARRRRIRCGRRSIAIAPLQAGQRQEGRCCRRSRALDSRCWPNTAGRSSGFQVWTVRRSPRAAPSCHSTIASARSRRAPMPSLRTLTCTSFMRSSRSAKKVVSSTMLRCRHSNTV